MKISYWWFGLPVLLAMVAGYVLSTGNETLTQLMGALLVVGLAAAGYWFFVRNKQ